MKKTVYACLATSLLSFASCVEPEDVLRGTNIEPEPVIEFPSLVTGTADFSTYVAVGNSLTSGFTDGALFIAAQENSFPNILAQKFSLIGGGSFTQPLTNDNFGGLALAGNRIQSPRLVTTGSTPQTLESVVGPVTVSTDIAINNPTGPFNNMGVPGAKSFHLLAPGYGNINNLPALANPYFVRMTGDTPNASVLDLTLQQEPTFFSLWIGNNDILSFATSGGDDTNFITPVEGPAGIGFNATYNAIIAGLTSRGAKGVIANIPDITAIPHFTTVPYNAITLNQATANQLNTGFELYNAGIIQAYTFLVQSSLITQEAANIEITKRTVNYVEGQNPILILDEDLTDLTSINPQLISMRPATENDLFVLPAASIIGTAISETQINGISIPLEDKWVLTPEEQEAIAIATRAYNNTIATAAASANLALLDANTLLNELATTGITSNNFTITSDLVTGGAFSLDGIHLTARGYAFISNEIMKAIDNTYNTNFEASNNLLDIGTFPTNYSPTLQ